jgi:hypothetical protein
MHEQCRLATEAESQGIDLNWDTGWRAGGYSLRRRTNGLVQESFEMWVELRGCLRGSR